MVDASIELLGSLWLNQASTVGTSAAAAHDPILRPSQKAAFYAAGRRWVFYTDGVNLVFRSSTDGITWTAATNVRACIRGDQYSIHFDGTYIHYAYTEGAPAKHLYYRRGIPQTNGAINMSAVEQTVYQIGEANNFFTEPSVSVDDNGYPWILFNFYDDEGPNYSVWALRSNNNNGTWDGDELHFSLESGRPASVRGVIVPLTMGRMFCLWDKDDDVLGRLYEGVGSPFVSGSWASEEDSGADIATPGLFNAISFFNNVHLVWTEKTTLKLQHRQRIYGAGWTASHEIYDAVLADMGPSISRGSEGKSPTLYVFWAPNADNPTADHVFYKTSIDDGINWSAAPVDWINESADTFPTPNQQSSFLVQEEFYIGCVWVRSSPDDIRYGELRSRANESKDLDAQFEVGQDSADLLGKISWLVLPHVELFANGIIRHVGMPVELPGESIVRNIGSTELLTKFEAQDKEELLMLTEIRHVGMPVELLGESIVRNIGSTELLSKFEAQDKEELLARCIIRHIETVELLGGSIARHETAVEFLSEIIVRQEVSVDLLGRIIIRHVGIPVELIGAFIVRHTGIPRELLGRFIVRHTGIPRELLGRSIIRHTTSKDLYGKTKIRHTATPLDLPAYFWIRSSYRLWTNRRYLNGVVELNETLIGNAMLEYVIEGVMQDIQSYLINCDLDYSDWIDISLTPKLIKRATTYGTVAALYARRTRTFTTRVIPTIAPITITVIGDEERAMNHWRGKMNTALEFYVSSQAGDVMLTSTDDEEPVFSMEDIPPVPSAYTPWYQWLMRRET